MTAPTEWVFVSAMGVVSSPDSRIHWSPVTSPLRLVADWHAGDVGDRVHRPWLELADLDPQLPCSHGCRA